MDHIIEQAEAIQSHLCDGHPLDDKHARLLADAVVKLAYRVGDIEAYTKMPEEFTSQDN